MITTTGGFAPYRGHFGARPKVPRPILLTIVFGMFLMIVGVTAAAQTMLVSDHASRSTMQATLDSDTATIRTFVGRLVTIQDLDGTAPAWHVASAEADLRSIGASGGILRIEVRSPDGTIRLSTDSTARGTSTPVSVDFDTALGGHVAPRLIQKGEPTEDTGVPIASGDLIRVYFPLVATDGQVRGVVAVWNDGTPILTAIERVRNDVVLVMLSGAAIVGLLLFVIFRAAQKRITQQTMQLIEATRLDALTGLPNHGAMVGDLSTAIETARSAATTISVAVLDLDNFRNVNDTHGHEAGDTALLQLTRTLGDSLPADLTVGRYGPDEFIVIARGLEAGEVEPYLKLAQASLADQDLEIDSPERLPISMSGAIVSFPADADSVTALLSAAAVLLADAKLGGGGQVLTSSERPAASDESRTFDVLQGLVFAVDTKDRYTRRHSEDVSRYASFLARRLGLDDEFVAGITAAGLLHDVGKIAIPDAILRRPGRLSDDERRIVREHVTLGESIVRNVPHLDLVRSGIRHHHERWDGRGYVDELAGEAIPLVARILAVADTFSAMTTTRPYRKALPVTLALGRLADAAGTQLEERLVTAFIEGIETEKDPPLPGDEGRTGIWIPHSQVA